jgi:hypothetical protein
LMRANAFKYLDAWLRAIIIIFINSRPRKREAKQINFIKQQCRDN